MTDTSVQLKYDVVIIGGGGPSGSSSAIASQNAGAKTLVLEKRKHNNHIDNNDNKLWASRNRVVAIDDSAIDIIKQLSDNEIEISRIEKYIIVTDSDHVHINRGAATSLISSILVGRKFEGTISINYLEQSLYKKACEKGVDYIFDVTVTSVCKNKIKFIRNGKLFVVETKFIIIAEGTKSKTLSDLGFRRTHIDSNRAWYVANFKATNSYQGRYILDATIMTNESYHSMAITYKEWTTVYLTSFDGKPIKNDIKNIMLKLGSKLNVDGEYNNDVLSFTCFPDRILDFTDLGMSLLVVGDAARNVGPFTGFGVTLSIQDSQYIGDFISKALTCDKKQNEIWEQYESNMKISVSISERQIETFELLSKTLQSKSPLVQIGILGSSVLGNILGNIL